MLPLELLLVVCFREYDGSLINYYCIPLPDSTIPHTTSRGIHTNMRISGLDSSGRSDRLALVSAAACAKMMCSSPKLVSADGDISVRLLRISGLTTFKL